MAECLADDRACKIINNVTGNFGLDNEQLGPVSGMKTITFLKFLQVGFSPEDVEKSAETQKVRKPAGQKYCDCETHVVAGEVPLSSAGLSSKLNTPQIAG